ncbi:Emc2p [Sugiyamaella lignohabitans]|uniref:ER membrane protein complex subunit 2 n=1 Tax=Sugiyamaella lignohabitans TaxID=796027 RepID=A0A167C2M7_9ASCO|nr:Emc2p [Sugiyamaella lignohabitans]ANB11144.1 Emc2p [Sugiyamaella lignohabitans]
MSSETKEKLLTSMANASYYNASPRDLESLHAESRQYLSKAQHLIPEEQLLGLLEQHFYLALLTCKDSEAKLVLQRLTDRITEDPSRVAILKAQYIEATDGPEAAQKFLSARPTGDLRAFKRKTVILKQKGDIKTYIKELLRYVEEVAPNDSEAWAELAEAYVSIGQYPQAIHALEEVLISAPQASNIFARLGEVFLIEATTSSPNKVTSDQLTLLIHSAQHFLRSVELSPDYIRGWCGALIASSKILAWPKLAAEESTKYTKISKIAKKQTQRLIKTAKEAAISDEDIAAAKIIIAQYEN